MRLEFILFLLFLLTTGRVVIAKSTVSKTNLPALRAKSIAPAS